MNRLPADRTDHRERVVTLLAMIASDHVHEALSERIEPERLVFELCRAWFDDVYLPGSRYIDSWKGDFSETAAHAFRTAFDDDELAALERFHRFFELRIDMLRDDCLERKRVPLNDSWQSLARHASYVLERLDSDAERRRKRLDDLVSVAEWPSTLTFLPTVSEGSDPDTARQPPERR